MSKTAKIALPPGPPLPLAVQSILMASYGLRFLAGCQRRYGNLFTLRIPLSGKVVYLADPGDIKTVYAGRSACISFRRSALVLPRPVGRQLSICP